MTHLVCLLSFRRYRLRLRLTEVLRQLHSEGKVGARSDCVAGGWRSCPCQVQPCVDLERPVPAAADEGRQKGNRVLGGGYGSDGVNTVRQGGSVFVSVYYPAGPPKNGSIKYQINMQPVDPAIGLAAYVAARSANLVTFQQNTFRPIDDAEVRFELDKGTAAVWRAESELDYEDLPVTIRPSSMHLTIAMSGPARARR